MCLILVAWREHTHVPCLVAANRDEYYDRPTERAGWWADGSGILAGRDLTAGGTWFGVTRSGRFAAVTNFRTAERPRPDAPSRGGLVSSLLRSEESVAEALARLSAVGHEYNGFSIIFSDGERLAIYESARGGGRELGPGIYGLSNHLLDTPWPKVKNGKTQLRAAIDDQQAAIALLRDERPAPEDDLPRTGVDREWERALSSAFVRAAEYGTRCSTVLRIDGGGAAAFDEWSWNRAGEETERVSLSFRIA